jgi:alpha-D-ribose 1-methylphosphonate 5-triphosphate synthase subunit PhnG
MQESTQKERQAWLGLMAKAPTGQIASLVADAGIQKSFDWLRQPEIGSVMLRGRAGGTGTPFNLGEMTVTRCSLKIATGEVGHGYVQGRNKADAEAAALVDALMQTAAAPELRSKVLDPIEQARNAQKDERARKAAATKVDFFTMVRGED